MMKNKPPVRVEIARFFVRALIGVCFLNPARNLRILFLLLSLLVGNQLLAQEVERQLITTSDVGKQQFWSSDSQYFIYSYAGEWQKYHMASGLLSPISSWPLSSSLSTTENQIFAPYFNSNASIGSLIFESPNYRYLSYPTSNDGSAVLALADRQSLHKSVFDSISVVNPQSSDDFRVIWSEDSSAFIATIRGDEGGLNSYIYASNYETDLSDTKLLDINDQSGSEFNVQQAYDLSKNGQRALLLVAISDPHNPTQTVTQMSQSLLVWDVSNSTNNQLVQAIDGHQILAASFASDNDEKIVIAMQSGIVLYDLATNATRELPSSVDLRSVEFATFSPNSQFLVVTQVSPEMINTFAVKISDLLPSSG